MLVRLATPKDADAILDVFVRVRERVKDIPEVRTPDETREYIRDVVVPKREVWVVEQDERVLGFAALRGDWIEHFYVHPLAQRFGIGSALLERLKESHPGGLKTSVYQKSTGLRRFYEGRGFALVELTDGAANDEQEPDASYAWRPADAPPG